MSDTTSQTSLSDADDGVTLRKSPAKDRSGGTRSGSGRSGDAGPGQATTTASRPGRPGRAPKFVVDDVEKPLTINLASLAMVGVAVFGLAQALLFLGFTKQLIAYANYVNDHAGKSKKANFNAADAINSLRHSVLIQAVIYAAVMLLLVWGLRRPRSASGTRWALLIIVVLTNMWRYVLPISHMPTAPQVTGVLLGFCAIVALLLIFAPPPSQRYFRACREAATPPELRGQPRPGLGSLFSRRPAGQAAGVPAGGARAASRPAQTRAAGTRTADDARPGAGKARAKVRSDADAIAKGAELARSRAKASKSRRTTD